MRQNEVVKDIARFESMLWTSNVGAAKMLEIWSMILLGRSMNC